MEPATNHHQKLLYCYAVVGQDINITQLGFENSQIFTIKFQDVYALVSLVSDSNFSQSAIDKNIKDLNWLTNNAPLHEQIITSIMQQTTTLPLKFLSIYPSEEQVIQIVSDKYADIKYFLHHMFKKQEFSLKVYVELSQLKAKITKESSEIHQLQNQAKHQSPGKAYFVHQKIDLLLTNQVQRHINEQKKSLINSISNIAVAVKQNDLLSKKTTAKDMMLNLAILIKSEDAPKLSSLITNLQQMHPIYQFHLSGPFAAYNFIK